MRGKNPEDIIREMKKKKHGTDKEWREYWFNAGPIRFAEEFLFCPPNVPAYPNWQSEQTEIDCTGCGEKHPKFHSNGIPYHIILSEDQKQVLTDAWQNNIRLILISAGRGAGKTFILAVWDCWRLCTKDYYEITCMGGSAEQSKIIQKYMDFWRRVHPQIGRIINRSPKAIGNRGCLTYYNSEVKFIPCSPTAAMGPHVNEVQADEVCAAESKGVEGQEAIEAIDWQITGRPDTFVWMTSTSHFLLGKFYEILMNPHLLGFKVYFWGIAKHVSGKPNNQIYTDRDPTHWKPAVWWVTEEDIQKLRRRKSNEEWLCWALGYPSLASGQVFKRGDLEIAVCNICEKAGGECIPYKFGHCKLIEMFNLGDITNPIKFIIDRKAGFDFGDPAPCALTIGGTRLTNKGNVVFILYSEEMKGLSQTEVIDWINNKLSAFHVQEFNPDPSIGGKHVNEMISELGYAVNILDEGAKEERVQNLKAITEKHNIVVPVAFWQLINSLKAVHRDNQGRIVKLNDHSFDSICYLCCDWGELEGNVQDVFDTVYEMMGLQKPTTPVNTEETESEFFTEKGRGVKLWDD